MEAVTEGVQDALFEQAWNPRRPLAGPKKSGPYQRMSREHAATFPYVEANALVMKSLIITDVDVAGADWAADLAGLPAPTYTATNPHTTTGHVVYGLDAPVCLTDAARRRPINLLARIEHGLNTVLEGDPAYGGRITKNPLNDAHVTLWGERLYNLKELASALDDLHALPTAGNARRNVTHSIVGRNVALFDLTRKWAYRAIRSYWDAPAAEWDRAVYAHATHANETIIANEFSAGPLAFPEVAGIVRSIARYVRRNNTPESFAARQRAVGLMQKPENRRRAAQSKGRKSGETRRLRALERAYLLEVSE